MAAPTNGHDLNSEERGNEQQQIKAISTAQRKRKRSEEERKKKEKEEEKILLSQTEKEAIAAKTYAENEKDTFERQRQSVDNDWKARIDLSIGHADLVVGDTYESNELKATSLLKRDLTIAEYEYRFVRLDGESEAEVKRRVKAYRDKTNFDFDLSDDDDYLPKVVDPALLSKIRGKFQGGSIAYHHGKFVVIHIIDTTEVRRFDDPKVPVEFFLAQDLLREFDIQGWSGWNAGLERPKLRKPYYTHEWITHHAVYVPQASETSAYEAKLEDLIDGGLYELIPELRTTEEDDMKGLYHRCVYTRSLTHRKIKPCVKPITQDDLDLATRLAERFKWKHRVGKESRVRHLDSGRKPALVTPHVNIILDLLGIHERPEQNPVLRNWAMSGVGGFTFCPAGFRGLTRVPNNIPEQMQTVELAREVCQALHAGPLPQTKVWLADSRFNWRGKWLWTDAFCIKIRQKDPKKKRKSTDSKKKGKDQPPDQNDASDANDTANDGSTMTNDSNASTDQSPSSDDTLPRKRQKTGSASESFANAADPAADTVIDRQAEGDADETSPVKAAGDVAVEAVAQQLLAMA